MSASRLNPGLDTLLRRCVNLRATDLHLSVQAKPWFRVDGHLETDENAPTLQKVELEKMVFSLLNARQREQFEKANTLDLAYALPSGERFRVNIFRERNGVALAARLLDDRLRRFEDLNLPPILEQLADSRDGLVLVTGPTGSGKSTTLATMIHRINRTQARHILTIEDPIEYVHTSERSLVRQRELHAHVDGFAEAVRSALREDPDVVLVGEMRDLETMRTAITLAETGHLVFSTLHTGSAVGALDRLVGAFPSGEREALCQQLSMTLRAVVAQRLLTRREKQGLIPAVELLIVTTGVANLIRHYKPQQILSAMESGSAHGMRTMEQSLAGMVGRGQVALEEARKISKDGTLLDEYIRMSRSSGMRVSTPAWEGS